MPLDATNRFQVWAQSMRESALGSVPGITKQDLRAAVDAADDWIEANAASYNSALPQPFRGNANLAQKTLLLCWVAMRRAGRLPVQGD